MTPSPADLRALAERHGLTASEIAALFHMKARMWRYLVAGEKKISPAAYELLLIKLGEHPDYGPRAGQTVNE